MNETNQILIKKIKGKQARIGIIGLGYVGLPLVLRFCEEGFKVLGFDIDPDKIKILNQGNSYIQHISSKQISGYIDKGLFQASNDFNRLTEMDCIIICVPTPLTAKLDMPPIKRTPCYLVFDTPMGSDTLIPNGEHIDYNPQTIQVIAG